MCVRGGRGCLSSLSVVGRVCVVHRMELEVDSNVDALKKRK